MQMRYQSATRREVAGPAQGHERLIQSDAPYPVGCALAVLLLP